MYINVEDLDFRPLGHEIKRKRIEAGLSQKGLGMLVDRTQRSVMNFENKGKMPTLDVFYKIVTILGISVDQFFYPSPLKGTDTRKSLDFLLDKMDEKELSIVIGTAQAIINAKDIEK